MSMQHDEMAAGEVERRSKFDRAQHLDAEAAAHKVTIGNETGEPVEFRVVAEDEPTFGGRLRHYAEKMSRGYEAGLPFAIFMIPENLALIAAAIDEDRDALECERIADGHEDGYQRACQDLRRQIGEAVERLRYTVITCGPSVIYGMIGPETGQRDMLDAEPFLAEIDRIFGERRKGQFTGIEAVLADYLAWSLVTFPASSPAAVVKHLGKELRELEAEPTRAEEIADVVFLAVHLSHRAGVELVSALRCKLGELRTRTWKEPDADGVVEHIREHEPTSERRKRYSATFEDHQGRVERVDR